MARTRQQNWWRRLDDKLQLAELDQRASHAHRHRFCGVELVVYVCGLADGEFGLVVLGERTGLAFFCCRCWRSRPFCLGRSRSVLLFPVWFLLYCLSECSRACLALSCHAYTAHTTITIPPAFIFTLTRTQANTLFRWLRMAHSLDLQLCLRLRPLQLEDPNNRCPRSLRRLGPGQRRQCH